MNIILFVKICLVHQGLFRINKIFDFFSFPFTRPVLEILEHTAYKKFLWKCNQYIFSLYLCLCLFFTGLTKLNFQRLEKLNYPNGRSTCPQWKIFGKQTCWKIRSRFPKKKYYLMAQQAEHCRNIYEFQAQ